MDTKELMIAKMVHECNKAYCEYIGDFSQKHWEYTPEEIKNSAISGVHFTLENNTTPEQQHQQWMDYKIKEGWTYGDVKDIKKKTHPCLVPYNSLPEDQKFKDHLFRAICMIFK